MLKYIIYLSLALFLFSCSEEEQNEDNEVKAEQFSTEQSLIVENENGRYTEWYPGRKQIKITGTKDKQGRKMGIWKLFTEKGVQQSVTEYKEGKKDGISIVRHPNGTIYYRGEYKENEPVGVWKFYNEQGQLVERKFYDEE